MSPSRIDRACILSGTTLALFVIAFLPMALVGWTQDRVFLLVALILGAAATAFAAPCAIVRMLSWIPVALGRRS